MRMARDTIGDKLREIEALDRLGLLRPPPQQRGLLSPSSDPTDPVPVPPIDHAAERANLKTATALIDAMPNIGPNSAPPQMNGLLASNPKPSGGLLGRVANESSAPRRPAQDQRRPNLWSMLDDALFGGEAGARASERRQRDQGEAQQAAHREAFAVASQGGAFDPARYQARMAELGQAPDMDGLVQLEGVTDSRDVRGARGRNERRAVTAGALAPALTVPEDERPFALQGVADYLASEGMSFNPATPAPQVRSMVGAGMGADAYLDNERGDRAQGEAVRANLAAEDFRTQDLQARQEAAAYERQYQQGRDETDDQFRARQLDIQERGLTVANSTGEIAAAIQTKAITMGVESLTPEERAIYDRALAAPGAGGIFGLLGGTAPAAPAATPTPTPRPAARGASRDQAVTVSSQAEFDALPPGAWFINPADDRVMQKAQ